MKSKSRRNVLETTEGREKEARDDDARHPPLPAGRLAHMPAEFLEQEPSDPRARINRREDKERLEHEREVRMLFVPYFFPSS